MPESSAHPHAIHSTVGGGPVRAARLRALVLLTVTAALLWHGMTVARVIVAPQGSPRELATHHHGARVALEGGDPYDRAAVTRLAKADGLRGAPPPLRTPPPSLALGLWSARTPFDRAAQLFVGAQELAVLLSGLLLWRLLRPVAPHAGAVVAAVFAVATPLPLALQAGRGHLLLLCLATLATSCQVAGRQAISGAIVGLGAAIDPVLAGLAAPWMLQRRGGPLLAALAAFAAAHLAVAPAVGVHTVVRYWTVVAPSLLGGWTASLDLGSTENHALLGAFASGRAVPAAVAVGQLLTGLALLASLGWQFRRPTRDPLAHVARTAGLLLVPLLVGTLTLDPHLVLALPALCVAVVAVGLGRLEAGWAVPVGLAAGILLYPTKPVGELVRLVLEPGLPVLGPLVAEGTTAALVLLLVLAARLGAQASVSVSPAAAEQISTQASYSTSQASSSPA